MLLGVLADKINVNDLVIYALVVVFGAVATLLKRSYEKGKQGKSGAEEPGAGQPPVLPYGQKPAVPPPVPPGARVGEVGASPPGYVRRRAVARRAAVVVPPVAEEASWDVAEGVRRERERMSRDEAERSQRMATAPPLEADTAGIEARLLHVRPAAAAAAGAKAGVLAELTGPDALRTAILHYEIFSPPKALRTGPEPWEL